MYQKIIQYYNIVIVCENMKYQCIIFQILLFLSYQTFFTQQLIYEMLFVYLDTGQEASEIRRSEVSQKYLTVWNMDFEEVKYFSRLMQKLLVSLYKASLIYFEIIIAETSNS